MSFPGAVLTNSVTTPSEADAEGQPVNRSIYFERTTLAFLTHPRGKNDQNPISIRVLTQSLLAPLFHLPYFYHFEAEWQIFDMRAE